MKPTEAVIENFHRYNNFKIKAQSSRWQDRCVRVRANVPGDSFQPGRNSQSDSRCLRSGVEDRRKDISPLSTTG